MSPDRKSTSIGNLSRFLSPELEVIQADTFGLCAESNDLEGVCAAAPINFIGTLLYHSHMNLFGYNSL